MESCGAASPALGGLDLLDRWMAHVCWLGFGENKIAKFIGRRENSMGHWCCDENKKIGKPYSKRCDFDDLVLSHGSILVPNSYGHSCSVRLREAF